MSSPRISGGIKRLPDATTPSASVADFAGQLIVYPSGAFGIAYHTAAGAVLTDGVFMLNAAHSFTGRIALDDLTIRSTGNPEMCLYGSFPGYNVIAICNTHGDQGDVSGLAFRDHDDKERGAIGWGPRGTGPLAFPFSDCVYLESSILTGSGPTVAKDIVIHQTHRDEADATIFNLRVRIADGGAITLYKNGDWTGPQSALATFDDDLITFNAPLARRVASVAYAATITPDADTTDLLIIGALTGNLTLGTPTGTPTDGQKIEVQLLQDGTGGYTLTLGSDFIIPSSSSLTSPINSADFIAADALTTMLIEWSATRSKWKLVSFVPGY